MSFYENRILLESINNIYEQQRDHRGYILQGSLFLPRLKPEDGKRPKVRYISLLWPFL